MKVNQGSLDNGITNSTPAQSGKCEEFTYGGCQGNGNNFESLADCIRACDSAPDCETNNPCAPHEKCTSVQCLVPPCHPICELIDCSLPAETGPCEAAIPRFFFNEASQKCERFTYGGCGGNDNNFETQSDCQAACPANTCSLPSDSGPCEAAMPRFYFNSESQTCERFTYGGCQGNGNNFVSREECEAACPSNPVPDCENNNPCARHEKCVQVQCVTEPCPPVCEPIDCSLPADSGPCEAAMPRFFFNSDTRNCERFTYGGCGGNDNNFLTVADCEAACEPSPPPDCEDNNPCGPHEKCVEVQCVAEPCDPVCEPLTLIGPPTTTPTLPLAPVTPPTDNPPDLPTIPTAPANPPDHPQIPTAPANPPDHPQIPTAPANPPDHPQIPTAPANPPDHPQIPTAPANPPDHPQIPTAPANPPDHPQIPTAPANPPDHPQIPTAPANPPDHPQIPTAPANPPDHPQIPTAPANPPDHPQIPTAPANPPDHPQIPTAPANPPDHPQIPTAPANPPDHPQIPTAPANPPDHPPIPSAPANPPDYTTGPTPPPMFPELPWASATLLTFPYDPNNPTTPPSIPIDCLAPADPGPCDAAFPRYFYNNETNACSQSNHTYYALKFRCHPCLGSSQRCEPFTYGGCQGNSNNFPSRERCEAACPQDPPEGCGPNSCGPCGECGVNEECTPIVCVTTPCHPVCQPVDICTLPAVTGPCKAALDHFYYNNVANACQPFTYGGCGGNGNNFETLATCQAACASPPLDLDSN